MLLDFLYYESSKQFFSAKRPFSHHIQTTKPPLESTQKKTNLSRRTLVKGKKSSLALNESKKKATTTTTTKANGYKCRPSKRVIIFKSTERTSKVPPPSSLAGLVSLRLSACCLPIISVSVCCAPLKGAGNRKRLKRDTGLVLLTRRWRS